MVCLMGGLLLLCSGMLLFLVPRGPLCVLLYGYPLLLLGDFGRLRRWDIRRCLHITSPRLLLGSFSIRRWLFHARWMRCLVLVVIRPLQHSVSSWSSGSVFSKRDAARFWCSRACGFSPFLDRLIYCRSFPVDLLRCLGWTIRQGALLLLFGL